MADSDDKTAESPEASVGDESSDSKPQASSENVSYDENGDAIFSDPATNYKYKWCKEGKQWKPMENEHYKWCSETSKWIPKATTENEFYRWCERTSQWVPKMEGKEDLVYGYDEKESCHTYTDKDGAVFFYDNERKAWIPKVDDDFLAVYQMNYGFVDNTTKEPEKLPDVATPTQPEPSNEESAETSNNAKKRKAPVEPPKWFEVAKEQNTKVYVTNLPLDTTEEEFGELMAKCGMVMKDLKSGKLKLKLYRDANGQLKGDGLCHYIKVCCFPLHSQKAFHSSPLEHEATKEHFLLIFLYFH